MVPERSLIRGLLQRAYDRTAQVVGGWRWVQRNRIARVMFLKSLDAARRLLGVPADLRWAESNSGVRLMCDLRDNLQAEIYYLRGYSEPEIDFVVSRLRPGDVFVDVGAHFGLFSIEAARAVGPGGRVVAFEPSPETRDHLKTNLDANGVAGTVEIVGVALGEKPGRGSLLAATGAPGDAGILSIVGEGDEVARVEVRSLDELVESRTVALDSRCAAIKIDVEGAELMALRGMKRTLAEVRPSVVLVETLDETLGRAGANVAEVFAFMRSVGYEALPERVLDPRRRSFGVNTAFVPTDGAT